MAAADPSPVAPAAPVPREPDTLTIAAPRGHGDLAGLCDRVGALLAAADGGSVVCDLGALTAADLATVHALARLHLTARRFGGTVRVTEVSEELHELLALVGLCDVVGPCAGATPPGTEGDRTAGTPSPCPGRTSSR